MLRNNKSLTEAESFLIVIRGQVIIKAEIRDDTCSKCFQTHVTEGCKLLVGTKYTEGCEISVKIIRHWVHTINTT